MCGARIRKTALRMRAFEILMLSLSKHEGHED
jgi:hypothetical protein